MIIVDRLIKLVVLVPGMKTDTTEVIARQFVHHWYSREYGLPESITSDRDKKFTSNLWSKICRKLDIKKMMSTARHQQTDGQSEIAIRTYKRTSKKFAAYKNQLWVEQIHLLEYALNNSISSSTGFTPFYLALGFHPRSFQEKYLVEEFDTVDLLKALHNNITKAKEAVAEAQDVQQREYNKKRRAASLPEVGSMVLLSGSCEDLIEFDLFTSVLL